MTATAPAAALGLQPGQAMEMGLQAAAPETDKAMGRVMAQDTATAMDRVTAIGRGRVMVMGTDMVTVTGRATAMGMVMATDVVTAMATE